MCIFTSNFVRKNTRSIEKLLYIYECVYERNKYESINFAVGRKKISGHFLHSMQCNIMSRYSSKKPLAKFNNYKAKYLWHDQVKNVIYMRQFCQYKRKMSVIKSEFKFKGRNSFKINIFIIANVHLVCGAPV